MTRHSKPQSLTFLHPVFSPKGGIEGALVEVDGEPEQLVFKPAPHLEEAIAAFNPGDVFDARIEALPASDKGDSAHPLHELIELVSQPEAEGVAAVATTTGRVVRFNYARHGEVNGVVLDNGDFVHLRPDGYRQARLAIGDRVEAAGHAQALRFGKGRAIEAEQVNGQDIAKPKPKPHHDKLAAPKKPKPPAPPAHHAR